MHTRAMYSAFLCKLPESLAAAWEHTNVFQARKTVETAYDAAASPSLAQKGLN